MAWLRPASGLLDGAKTELTLQNSLLVQRVQPVSAAEISKNQHGSKSSDFFFFFTGVDGEFGVFVALLCWVNRVLR